MPFLDKAVQNYNHVLHGNYNKQLILPGPRQTQANTYLQKMDQTVPACGMKEFDDGVRWAVVKTQSWSSLQPEQLIRTTYQTTERQEQKQRNENKQQNSVANKNARSGALQKKNCAPQNSTARKKPSTHHSRNFNFNLKNRQILVTATWVFTIVSNVPVFPRDLDSG